MANIKRTTVADKEFKHRGRVIRHEGIYLGYVKNNADAQRMGRLKVWIPDFGSLPDDKDSWVSVSYVSPFAGATDPNLIDNNTQKAGGSQTSYGFWAVPPDLENQVIVSFINGDPSRGVWLGCLYQQFMNHMVPGQAAAPNYQHTDKDVPVAEYNKKTPENIRNDITRPELASISEGISVQGLIDDNVRGVTYASARRNPVSNVYGFTTPGPAVPTDPADTPAEIITGVPTDATLPGGLGPSIPSSAPDPSKFAGALPDISGQIGGVLGGISGSLPSIPSIPGVGVSLPDASTITTVAPPELPTDPAGKDSVPGDTIAATPSQRRKGGWQFYFDDETNNEHMRIRSRNGSQLLIDDTNGLVYAINRAGTSWIQMDAEGNFDIFAAKSVSVRSQEDINFRADRDVNLEAGRNIKMKATNDFTGATDGSVGAEDEGEGGGNIRIEALKDMQTIVKNNHATQVTEGSMTVLVATGNRAVTIEGDDQLDITGAIITQADGDADINVGGTLTISASEIGIGTGNFNVETGGNIAATGDVTAGGNVYGSDVLSSDAALNDLHNHDHVIASGSSAGKTKPFTSGGGSGSASGPTAASATAVQAFDPAATNSKTNVLATFSDDDNFERDTQEGVVTLVGRFLTYEPCPEHINKGAARDDDA